MCIVLEVALSPLSLILFVDVVLHQDRFIGTIIGDGETIFGGVQDVQNLVNERILFLRLLLVLTQHFDLSQLAVIEIAFSLEGVNS